MDRDEETALSSGVPATPSAMDAGTMLACGSCGRVIQIGDAFCRYCGKPQGKRKKKTAWYYEPVWILVLGFVLIGPLVLPLVIKSPKLSRGAKWGISLALLVYSVFLVYLGYVTFVTVWRMTTQFTDQLQGIY